MNVKTLTGPSIRDALAEAREQLGDGVVLVESTPAADGEPARVTVMSDGAPAAEAVAEGQPRVPAPTGGGPGSVPKPPGRMAGDGPHEGGVAGGSIGFGYGAANAASNGKSGSGRVRKRKLVGPGGHGGADFGDALARQRGTGRGRFFPPSGTQKKGNAREEAGATEREKRLEAQLERLSERLDGMEQRFGGAVIGSGQRWAAHPLFGALLEQGMRPGTLTTLFGELAERGHDPEGDDPEDLRWALAQVIRGRLHVPTPKRSAGGLALIGPGGAGKTSLLLKLATHKSFFARREPAVVVVRPEDEEGTAYQNPTGLYRRFGLPVQSVRTEEEMAEALDRVDHFGQLLVDTPPLPLPLASSGARPVLRRLERLLRPLMPLDVHLALSATHALGGFEAEAFERLPLAPSAVALTHLDEAPGWGRVAEWLMTLDLPVQFVSDSPAVPEGARSFSPTWFVEEMMDL